MYKKIMIKLDCKMHRQTHTYIYIHTLFKSRIPPFTCQLHFPRVPTYYL